MTKPPIPWRPYLLLTLTTLFWAGNFVLARGIRELIPPVSLNFWRWAGALSLLLPFTLPRLVRQRDHLRRHWRWLILMSIPSIVLFNTFIYAALQSVSATNTALVNATTPVFIVLLAWWCFRDRLSFRQLTGVFLSLAGLLFIISRGDIQALVRLSFAPGDLWTLGAAVAWAGYSVMLRQRPADIDGPTFLTAIMALGVIILIPCYLLEVAFRGGFDVNGANLAGIAYVSVFPSLLAYLFWNRGVEAVGAGRAGIFMHLVPVFAIVLAAAFLGERLSGYHLGGIGLIFTGIGLTTYPASSDQPAQPLRQPGDRQAPG